MARREIGRESVVSGGDLDWRERSKQITIFKRRSQRLSLSIHGNLWSAPPQLTPILHPHYHVLLIPLLADRERHFLYGAGTGWWMLTL